MKMLTLLAAAAALALGAAAAATEPAGQPEKGPTTPSADTVRRICKTSVTIGTRLGGTRTCRTAAEWAEMRAQSRLATERMQANGNPSCRAASLGGGCSADGP
jgi:hypothetical protein